MVEFNEVKYLLYKGKLIKIWHCSGLWYDLDGTIYGLSEDENSVDKVSRCGIGWVSVPKLEGCEAHDFAYSSTAYQLFHTRAEADAMLESHLEQEGHSILGRIFRFIANIFGGKYWEVEKTK